MIDPLFGVSASAFVKALASIDAPEIALHINSPGGDVFEARAMATAIAAHTANVTAYVDGVAASAASTVAVAADKVVMAPGSFLMVHNAWALGVGNAADLRDLADVLDKIDGALVEDYARASGQDPATVKAWLDAETWFTAQEAVDAGLADSVSDPDQDGDDDEPGSKDDPDKDPMNRWDLSVYGRGPRASGERWTCSGARDLPILKESSWDGGAAAKEILDHAGIGTDKPNHELAKQGFVFSDLANLDERGGYSDPFCRVVNGKLEASSAGVDAAAHFVPRTDVPQNIKEEGERLIAHYQSRIKSDSQNSAHAARSERLRRATYS